MPFISERDYAELKANKKEPIDLWPIFWAVLAVSVCSIFITNIIVKGTC